MKRPAIEVLTDASMIKRRTEQFIGPKGETVIFGKRFLVSFSLRVISFALCQRSRGVDERFGSDGSWIGGADFMFDGRM